MVSLVPMQNPVPMETATLTWTIDKFAQVVVSPVFSPPNSNNQFKFKLARNASALIPILNYLGPNEEARFYYHYALLDANQGRHHTREILWEYNKSLGNESHFTLYISHDKCEQMLVNGTLKVYCEVRIYDVKSIRSRPSQMDSFGKLSENYEQLLESGNLSDFTVKIGGKHFRVHKTVLATRSPVFAAMFAHETKEVMQGRVVIKDMEVEVFELMIRYIYTGKVDPNILVEHAAELLVAADRYHLPLLKTICENLLIFTLTAESVCDVLVLSDMYNAQQLKSKSIEYIVQHAQKVMQNKGWKELAKTSRADLIALLFEKVAGKDD